LRGRRHVTQLTNKIIAVENLPIPQYIVAAPHFFLRRGDGRE